MKKILLVSLSALLLGSMSVPTLTLTSPAGGERWVLGSSQNITWTEEGVSAGLRLSLAKDDGTITPIARDIPPGTGSYSWTVGNLEEGTAAAGTGYRILVQTMDGSQQAMSGAFSIVPARARPSGTAQAKPATAFKPGHVTGKPTAAAQAASIQIVSPNGGERLYSGQTITVEYRTTGAIDRITTWLNQLTPTTFQRHVNANAPNTGSFQFQIPNVGEGGDFKFKIHGHVSGDTWVEDVSNGPFKIYKGLDLVPSRAKFNLKIDYGDNNFKDYLFYFTSPVGTVMELIDWQTIKGQDLELEFRVKNEGRFWPADPLNILWRADIYKDGVHFMAKNGTVTISEFQNSADVKTVYKMGAGVKGLLKIEIILDPGHGLPEAEFFRRNNTLTFSFNLTHKYR